MGDRSDILGVVGRKSFRVTWYYLHRSWQIKTTKIKVLIFLVRH